MIHGLDPRACGLPDCPARCVRTFPVSAIVDTAAWRFASQILGVPEGAAAEDVRRAFRRGAQRVHPDKCRLPRAEAAFKTLKAAAESAHAAGG